MLRGTFDRMLAIDERVPKDMKTQPNGHLMTNAWTISQFGIADISVEQRFTVACASSRAAGVDARARVDPQRTGDTLHALLRGGTRVAEQDGSYKVQCGDAVGGSQLI